MKNDGDEISFAGQSMQKDSSADSITIKSHHLASEKYCMSSRGQSWLAEGEKRFRNLETAETRFPLQRST